VFVLRHVQHGLITIGISYSCMQCVELAGGYTWAVSTKHTMKSLSSHHAQYLCKPAHNALFLTHHHVVFGTQNSSQTMLHALLAVMSQRASTLLLMEMWFLTLRIILRHSDHEEVSPSAQQLVYLQRAFIHETCVLPYGQSYVAACLQGLILAASISAIM